MKKKKKKVRYTIDSQYRLVEKSRKINKAITDHQKRWAKHLGISLESFKVIQKICDKIKPDDPDPSLRRDLITSYVVGFTQNTIDSAEAIKFLFATTTLTNFQVIEMIAEIETWESIHANNNRSYNK